MWFGGNFDYFRAVNAHSRRYRRFSFFKGRPSPPQPIFSRKFRLEFSKFVPCLFGIPAKKVGKLCLPCPPVLCHTWRARALLYNIRQREEKIPSLAHCNFPHVLRIRSFSAQTSSFFPRSGFFCSNIFQCQYKVRFVSEAGQNCEKIADKTMPSNLDPIFLLLFALLLVLPSKPYGFITLICKLLYCSISSALTSITVKARTLTISLAETSAQDDMATEGPATTADGGDGTTTEAATTADDGTTTAGDGDGDGTTAFLGTDVFLQRPDPSSVIELTPENPCFWMESHDGSLLREPALSHK